MASLKDRLKRKREDLSKRGGGTGKVVFIKEGTIRVRPLSVGEDNEFVAECTQFYLGEKIKGVFSPSQFGQPCAIMEAYDELKNSKNAEDKDLAKKFVPKKRYLMPCILLSDDGKTPDDEKGVVLVQLTNNLYQQIIDLYLDTDEWGDMTDPESGYDLKLSRTGKTLTDTEYAVKPCKPTPVAKKYKKVIDLEALVKEIMPTYEETKSKIEEYLNISGDDSSSSSEEDDDSSGKKLTKEERIARRKKKKKLNADI